MNDSASKVLHWLRAAARGVEHSAASVGAMLARFPVPMTRSPWRGLPLPGLTTIAMRMNMPALCRSEAVALIILSALDVTGLTPLGPLP